MYGLASCTLANKTLLPMLKLAKSFFFTAPRLWDRLPLTVRRKESTDSFKIALAMLMYMTLNGSDNRLHCALVMALPMLRRGLEVVGLIIIIIIISNARDLSRPMLRHFTVRHRSPVGLECSLSLERTLWEHVLDRRQWKCTDCRTPIPATAWTVVQPQSYFTTRFTAQCYAYD